MVKDRLLQETIPCAAILILLARACANRCILVNKELSCWMLEAEESRWDLRDDILIIVHML